MLIISVILVTKLGKATRAVQQRTSSNKLELRPKDPKLMQLHTLVLPRKFVVFSFSRNAPTSLQNIRRTSLGEGQLPTVLNRNVMVIFHSSSVTFVIDTRGFSSLLMMGVWWAKRSLFF